MRCQPSFAVTLLASVCLVGCRGSDVPEAEFVDAPTQLTVQANNQFACDLFKQLSQNQPGENQFLSPWSISGALAIALEGARAETALEMGQVLGLPKELRQPGDQPWKLDPYHAGFATLLHRYGAVQNSKKNQPIRDKIDRLSKELNDLNDLNAKVRAERDFQTARELHRKAEDLAATINDLQSQVDLFELSIANAVWADKTYAIKKEFVSAVARYYGVEALQSADFIHQFDVERSRINGWVENKTKNRIKDLIPSMTPEEAKLVRMILVNAIYFKGQWKEPFKKSRTTDQPFSDLAAGKTTVPLMARYGNTRYAAFNGDGSYFATPHLIAPNESGYPDRDGFQIAELPYKGGKLAMTVILPRNIQGLPLLEAKLTGDNLQNWLSKVESRMVDLALPRFKMEANYSLGEQLKNMGMKLAFTKSANFHGIIKPSSPGDDLRISKVLHKAFVEVNEEGTEAAAATASDTRKSEEKGPDRQPFIPVFRADHAFLFLIRDTDSGAILFMGSMTKANQK